MTGAAGEGQWLVFARCAGFIFRAPGFSHPAVPPPLRAGLAYALSLALWHPDAALARTGSAGFVFALAIETLFGSAVGVAASMLYDGAYAGGRALDDYVGIRASVPSAEVAAGAGFGRLWALAFTTAFFVLGGYRPALSAFGATFVAVPAGALVRASDLQTFAIVLPETLLRAAIFVAGPAIAIAFAAQVSLAIVARLVPRFSTFTLAFPIVFACVVLATIAALPPSLRAASTPWLELSSLRAH
ncbi:MAG: flagellar biosynthetic protein FliR [Candidatus Eremiobacteraeota bacterium]|nr:flagellar biosynthetic protein FliR [Candidatus Eremiobacteraeota bacterium]